MIHINPNFTSRTAYIFFKKTETFYSKFKSYLASMNEKLIIELPHKPHHFNTLDQILNLTSL